MQVSKISFSGVNAKVSNNEIKTDVTKNSNSNLYEQKSNTTKYMIGATALAAAIAVGIIGHKNNWWRKAADAAEDLSKKGSETLDNAKNKASEIADNLSKKGSESIDNVDKNIPEITSLNPKPIEDIDYSDFSKIEGESYKDEMFICKDLKNSEGQLVRTYISFDGKTLKFIEDYDPITGNTLKLTCYKKDGKTLSSITDYDTSTKNPLKDTLYREDGKTLESTTDYDPTTGKQLKYTFYREDGKILYIRDYDPVTEKRLKSTYYNSDGTVDSIVNAS